MKHTKIYHITARFLLAATLLAVSWTSATAAQTAVPYAHIENDELVFYYDGNITDTDWAIVNFQNPESRGWHESASSIAGVRFDDSFKSYAPTVASYWFYGMSQVQTIDLSEIDMSQLTEADGMFQNCMSLTTIYANESWPAAEATVTPDGSTSSVTGVDMFNGCRSLVGGSNTAYDGQYTGYSYAHIDGGVDYPGYFTYKAPVTLQPYAVLSDNNTVLTFYYDDQKEARGGMDIGPFSNGLNNNFSSKGWYEKDRTPTIKTVVFDSSFANYSPTSTAYWFQTNSSIEKFVGWENLNTANVTDMTEMFSGCGVTTLDLSTFNTSSVNSMGLMFYNCTLLKTIYVGNGWNTSALTDEGGNMFHACTSIIGGAGTTYSADHINASYAHIDGGVDNPGYLTDINAPQPYAVLDGSTLYFYYDDQKDVRGGMSIQPFTVTFNDDWTHTITGRPWEKSVSSITTVVFDQSLANCTTLTSTAGWFSDHSKLTTIRGLEYLKTDNVTDMMGMFWECSGLTSLDLGSFNTENVTLFSHMFSGCSQLKSINLSSFNTSKAQYIDNMFFGCSSLTTLDLSSFNTSSVLNMDQTFTDCSSLKTIYASSEWSTAKVTDGGSYQGTFSGCTSLVGGAGTTYNANRVNYIYARIDGGTSAPGYFTAVTGSSLIYPDPSVMGLNESTTKSIPAGTLIGANSSMNLYVACQDDFYSMSSLGRDMFHYPYFYFNEEKVSVDYGMFGQTNPKDENGGTPGTTLKVPATGTAFSMYAKEDGYMYVWGVFATAKYYSLFEDGVAVGYRIAMITDGWRETEGDSSTFGEKIDVQFGEYNKPFKNKIPSITYAITNDSLNTINIYGEGVMVFPVKAGSTYIMNGNGCKFIFGGVHFAKSMESLVRLGNENAASYTLLKAGDAPTYTYTEVEKEPYAVLSDNNTVLTFYYDDQKSARGGMDIGPFAYLEHGFGEDQRPWHDVRESIVYAVIDESMAKCTSLVSTGWWFYGCKNLKSVSGWGNLPSESIVDMWGTFEYCSSLPSDPAAGGPDFSNFKSPNLKRTVCMFHGCTSMTSLDLSTLYTGNVTENEGMFEGCSALTTIYVGSGWDMSNATENWVDNMFKDCTSLVGGAGTRYDANNIGTSYAHIDGGTSNPGYLTELIRKTLTPDDYFEWNDVGANATKKSETPFENCNYILGQATEVPYGDPDVRIAHYADLSAYDRLEVTATAGTPRILLNRDVEEGYWNQDESQSHQIESTQSGWSSKYFSHSGNVWTVDLKQIVGDKGFAHLNAIKGNNWSTVTITKMELVKGIVENTSAEPYAVLSDNNTVLTFRYDNQKAANNGADVGPFDYFSKDKRGWAPYTSQITKAVFDPSFDRCTSLTSTAFWFTFMDHLETIENIQYLHTDNVENMDCMFDSCYVLRDLDVSHFVTSKVKNMQCMFNRCELLTSLDLRNFDTSSCEFMRGMFYDCKGLTSLNITSFDTSKNTSTESMFQFCSSLTTLDLSHFSTESVTDMSYMFGNCEKLTSLDLSSFNTSRVTEMECMFNQCTSLTNINFGQNFNTENVTKMSLLFSGCTGLTSLDVSRFNTQNVTEMTAMFQRCSGLTDLDLSSFNTERVSMMGWVFNYCSSLRSLNISGFSTANVTDIVNMFKECSSLASIQAGNAAIPDSIYAQIGNPNLLLYVNEASLAPSNVQNVVVNGAAENIVLTDAEGNNNFYCPLEFTARRISYTHNYKQATEIGVSRGWETIALPFTVQTITHEKNGPLAPFGVDGGKPFWLKQLTDNGLVSAQRIEANIPYLISMPNNGRYPADYNQAGNVTFSATNVVVPMTEQREMSGNNRTLRPTTMRVAQSPSVYAINRNAAYEGNPEGSIFVADYREVRPFEAYVEHPNGARFITLDDLMEGTTGIETIEQPQWSGAEQWWSIDGRKLNGKPSQKGVYIRNGKKVVVKATF